MKIFSSKLSKTELSGIGLAMLGATLFSSKAIMVKLSYQYDVDKLNLLMMRMGFSLPFYIAIAWYDYQKNAKIAPVQPLVLKEWLLLVFLGVVGYYLASLLDFWGLEYIEASMERLILFLYPTITALLAALVFKRKISRLQLIAIAISYVGITVAFWKEINVTQGANFWWGTLLVFGSALTYSFYLVGSEKLIPQIGVTRFTAYCMIISSMVMVIHYLTQSDLNFFNFHWQVYAFGLAIALFNTVIPSFIISAAILKIGSAKTSVLSSIGPVFVLVMSALILHEEITLYKVMGTLIVMFGVWMISNSKTR